MAKQLVDRRDLDFVIWEQMQAESLLKNDHFKERLLNAADRDELFEIIKQEDEEF